MNRGCRRMLAVGLIAVATAAMAGETQPPVELGKIQWLRDFDAGMARAKEEGKPVLLLFQEVPG